MIQSNLLLPVIGKTDQSFAVMDTLRFPLGILTGVGFIGGGAILKRGDLVTGVTTAATLWIITAIGLCIGGGQLAVGCAGTVIAFIVLSPFKLLDEKMPRTQKARVVISLERAEGITDLSRFLPPDCRSKFVARRQIGSEGLDALSFELRWKKSDFAKICEDVGKGSSDNFRLLEIKLINSLS